MPYNTRSRPLPSDNAPSPSSPIRRLSAARVSPVSPPPSVSPLIKEAIPTEDAENEVLMAVVGVLAEFNEPRSLSTTDMAKLTPHKAQVLSNVIRAHLRRSHPPHLLVRHDALDGGKIPTYSLALPHSPSAMEKAAIPTMAESFQSPSPLSSPSPLDSREYSDDMVIDEKPVIKTEDDEDMHEEFESPPGSVSPVITPPPLLSTSAPRLRSHFAEHILLPSRGISPDATSDGSSPPSTPRSPVSPLAPAKVPLSPTTGILSDGFRSMFLKEEQGLLEFRVQEATSELFPTPPMLETPFLGVNVEAQETVSASPQHRALPTLVNFKDAVIDWESDDWMLGPESMPLDELDRELTAAWRLR